jgi:hypothetical protein
VKFDDKKRFDNTKNPRDRRHNSRNNNPRRRNGRSNYRVGMVFGQCWSCKQRDVSCARLENGRFVCKDCDPVTYGEVARIEKERWYSGK